MQGEVGGAPSVTESPSVSADNPSQEEGWAMKKSKKSIRVSERVRSYLPEKYSSKKKKPVLKKISLILHVK